MFTSALSIHTFNSATWYFKCGINTKPIFQMLYGIHCVTSSACSLQSEVTQLRDQKRAIQQIVKRELDNGGWRFGPVASRLRNGIFESSTDNEGESSVELQRGEQIASEVGHPAIQQLLNFSPQALKDWCSIYQLVSCDFLICVMLILFSPPTFFCV